MSHSSSHGFLRFDQCLLADFQCAHLQRFDFICESFAISFEKQIRNKHIDKRVAVVFFNDIHHALTVGSSFCCIAARARMKKSETIQPVLIQSRIASRNITTHAVSDHGKPLQLKLIGQHIHQLGHDFHRQVFYDITITVTWQIGHYNSIFLTQNFCHRKPDFLRFGISVNQHHSRPRAMYGICQFFIIESQELFCHVESVYTK